MGEELKPCPFCGVYPHINPKYPADEGDDWTSIFCGYFHCPADVRVRYHGENHKKRAIEAWNRRETGKGD